MRTLIVVSLLLQTFALLYCKKQQKLFRHGRGTGGNLGAPGDCNDVIVPEPQWFKQKLDHSTNADVRTWKQQYFVNGSFFDRNNPGPVFLMIGGEGPADARWMVKGSWIEYAMQFKALCFSLEHRFYGKSFPTRDLSVKNLQYLSSYQALADIANFINAMNTKHGLQKSKWILFGGSYPGSLAAWMRMKYPHLVYAAVSSSGPLRAQVDFKEYYEVVLNALHEKTGDDSCINQVKLAHEQVLELINDDPNIIEKEFCVCKPFVNASSKDKQNFFSSIADEFAGLVQYNEDNRFSVAPEYKNLTINTVCNILTESSAEPAYKKLAKFNAIMLEKSKLTCMDYDYNNEIQSLKNITLNGEGTRQWMYQTCTEFGFYQTSSSPRASTVFGNFFNLDFYMEQCEDVFGKKFGRSFISKAVDWTNNNYGALNIAASRILFVHGTIDPWHALGITRSSNEQLPAILMKGTAHCANMYPSSDADSDALRNGRAVIRDTLVDWIRA